MVLQVFKKMLKYTIFYFSINFLTLIFPNFASDFYSKFHQNDYKVEFQRSELVYYNKSILNFIEVKTFKYNRTQPAVNITFNSKVNMSNEVEVVIQFYKFLSNEYRELPGSRFQLNMCKTLASNIVGSQIVYRCGNVTSCCIVQDTTYRICNMCPTESRFPPFIPTGEYRFLMDNFYRNQIFASIAMYIKIYRPIAIPIKH